VVEQQTWRITVGIPIATNYWTTLSGSAAKVVRCERCGASYEYRVRRKATGLGTSVLFTDNEGAQARARQRANQDLQQKLDRARAVVPCPACGWIQADMQVLARHEYLRRMRIAGLVLLGSLIVPFLMTVAMVTGPADQPVSPRLIIETSVLAIGLLPTGVALLAGRSLASKHYDPNGGDVEARLQQGQALAILLREPRGAMKHGTARDRGGSNENE
jgi:hypothetical protein